MHTSHELTTKRSYQGQDAARTLVCYLNGDEPSERSGRTRVLRIVETFHEVLRLLQKYPEWKSLRSIKPKTLGLLKKLPGWENYRLKPQELAAAESSLLEQVSRYERTLSFGVSSNREWDFSWGMTISKDADSAKDEWGSIPESDAIDAMVDLARDRLLPRVEKCLCGKWFFARFSHQHFCSSKCRDKHHQSSPEFKEKRRKYMRRYQRLQRSANVR
jgi:integrase